MNPAGSSPGGVGPDAVVPGGQPVGPAKSSGWLKGCFIAAGIFIVLFILVGAGIGWLVYSKSSKFFSLAMDKAKPEMMSYLASDLSPDERAQFEKTYDEMAAAIKKDGVIKSALNHPKSWELYQAISADKKIDAEEIKRWVSEWQKETGQQEELKKNVEQGQVEQQQEPQEGQTGYSE